MLFSKITVHQFCCWQKLGFENWDTFSENIQENYVKVNDYFCGLHFLVRLADQTETVLKAWNKLLYDQLLL